MDDQVYELLEKLPRKNLIHLMWGALNIMQGYNGRTRQGCILEAMGSAVMDNDRGTFSYKLPKTLKEIKENTENMGL
jgi:hypothetical protein